MSPLNNLDVGIDGLDDAVPHVDIMGTWIPDRISPGDA